MNTIDRAREISPYIEDIRKRIHSWPELGFEETETTALILSELAALGIEGRAMEPTGVVAEIRGEMPGERIALLRADIDALPIAECTGLDFASRREGVSHACGHDMHTAMLMGAARLLNERRSEFPGTVRLVFQPGEETGRGALKMLEQNVLEGVGFCFSQHMAPTFPVGTVYTSAGDFTAGAATFKITVTGRACHGAQPETGADALVAGAELVGALQALVSRETSPTTPLVLTVGTFHSGDRFNIVAGKAEMEGTVRAFDRALLHSAGERISRIASGVAAAYRCTAETQYAETCEALITDAGATQTIRDAACKVLSDPSCLYPMRPAMGSEDFAFFTAKAPCAYAFIGCGGEYPLHNERFNADMEVLPTGAALYAEAALEYLCK